MDFSKDKGVVRQPFIYLNFFKLALWDVFSFAFETIYENMKVYLFRSIQRPFSCSDTVITMFSERKKRIKQKKSKLVFSHYFSFVTLLKI